MRRPMPLNGASSGAFTSLLPTPLQAALAAGPRKVVVKRPLKGDALPGPAPSYTLRGKAVRFDVYTGVGAATEAK